MGIGLVFNPHINVLFLELPKPAHFMSREILLAKPFIDRIFGNSKIDTNLLD